jgi:uncharacterized membrane protein (UPF0127 family)
MYKKLIGVTCIGILLFYFFIRTELDRETYYIETRSETHKLELEIAKNPSDISLGLSRRTSIDDNGGMLFVFSHPKTLIFWMKDTKIPLDLLYLDKHMIIGEIHKYLAPYYIKEIKSTKPYAYALELNAGYIEKYKISVGDRLIRLDN